MNTKTLQYTLIGLALWCVGSAANAGGNYLYVLSNNIGDNENSVIAYERTGDGALVAHPSGPFLTGGSGVNNNTNGKLGPNDNDSPLIVSADKKFLFAVNGHSDTITVFRIQKDGSLAQVKGSPFDAHGINPVSLAISGNTLLVANRNEDPGRLAELSGAANSSYATFRIGRNGGLTFLSRLELTDGQKSTQILVSSQNRNIAFGNDFQVDADFDGDGDVSRLFGTEPSVQGRINSFVIDGGSGNLKTATALAIPETVDPQPEVPSIPLGLWDHPKKNLLYAGLVTRNQLGVFRYTDQGALSFVTAVPNSGQDICWLRSNKAGTRLYAVNNLPREDMGDEASTVTVFDISGSKAEQPEEIGRIQLPLPLGTFINNRNIPQPDSTAFQLTLDEREEFLYVVNQRINQTPGNPIKDGNLLHVLKIDDDGNLVLVASRDLRPDGVTYDSRPQGVVSLDL